ncbi:MAG TPA: hypothetical protein VI874_02255, partial [Candidatus Norongarragalinales archaeon]|nr:hypothetical protein [Candidatus Norongarragalinales archaeon]
RAFLLLSSAYSSGADLSNAFQTIAEDAFESQALESERKTAFALQKYTLYAGVLVVPAVLGSLWSWAPSSSVSDALWLGLHAHLFFFSVLSAAFIAAVERNLNSLGLNACVFLTLSFGTFYATSGTASAYLLFLP